MADTSESALSRFIGSIRAAVGGQTDQDPESAADTGAAESGARSETLQRKAEEYSAIMQQCASGDLTRRMETGSDNEAMDRIATEFNSMMKELEKTTGQLKSYIDEVDAAGAGVEQSAETVRTASEDVIGSIQNIAADAEGQREELETVSAEMDDVAEALSEFAQNHPDAEIETQIDQIESAAGDIRNVAAVSEEIQTETTNISAAAEEQAAELSEMSGRASDLQRYAQPLRDILERFDTESEHEFVFSGGPSPTVTGETEESTGD